ncbi:BA14K family protein [Mesorhizobium sp. M00.F.Ca.ET.216.01.1.1]|uniref:BA14K family protein n=1 Tax=Mesorhizobium sp. M00.F.Ca.ET.216.01.1.1 TaxID=2500528 RepID=UPI000FD98F3B|nr:BA14K family protein [Mesorhizobium sp. M00.F.Ca.ET.216.01.1.1]TGQ31288.1 BA14K family protein [Mesorhizobium sp. M00.F.Ca.ET.216.01.1.1]TJW09338.1 MAG: BA14K family protein [Mesorhizobium sp.]TJW41648.1 MAG: BA14K family protein [Mesorhizobium sp.]
MKALLGIAGGFVLTLAIFGSGLAFAIWLLTAEPPHRVTATVSVPELWTRNARPVNKAAQNFERVPAQQEPTAKAADASAGTAPAAPPDPTTTAAVQPALPKEQQQAELPAIHVEWCASRYRSYRPDDNSYMSYSGEQRPCISPYLDAGAAEPAAQPDETVGYAEANDAWMDGYATTDEGDGAQLSSDHVDYCFSRYRSYRPEDNSYQPYSGGPRRQCE